jgi:hypothetical protein
MRHVVWVQWRPSALGKIKSYSCQAAPLAILSSVRRARCRHSNSASSGSGRGSIVGLSAMRHADVKSMLTLG